MKTGSIGHKQKRIHEETKHVFVILKSKSCNSDTKCTLIERYIINQSSGNQYVEKKVYLFV